MATILQQPDALSLLGNLKRFLLSSDEPVSFVLKKGEETLITEMYNPDENGQLEIDVRDIIEQHLSYIISDLDQVYEQTSLVKDFQAVIDSTPFDFRVIRSGVANFSDTPSNFLQANFLTWQPQVKKVSFYQPEFLTYYAVSNCNAKLTAHFADGSSQSLTLAALTAGKAYTIPLQYSTVKTLLATESLPVYYDVWVETSAGVRLSYVQRYVSYNPVNEDEQWFLFENTLGGLDLFRASGKTTLLADHTHNIAEIDELAEEYQVDTTRKYAKNTGFLDNYERRWLLDFFPAKKKYIYIDQSLRQVVVLESDVSYVAGELPSNFNFTYKYCSDKPLLNLIRQELPEEVVFEDPDIGSFILPPRLNEFPRVSITEGALFPVQNPYSEQVGSATASMIAEFVKAYIGLTSAPGGVGHSHFNYDLLTSLSFISGFLKVSGQKISAGFAELAELATRALQADHADEAEHANTADTAHTLQTEDFAPGITTGQGGRITANGDAELESLILRRFLEVPELRYNRITIQVGNKWNAPGGGIIESVTPDEDLEGNILNTGIITLKLEDGEIGTVAEDDICQGIFHDHTVLANNAPEDADDSLGNFRFAGFYTCYFRVSEILESGRNSQFRYVLRPASESWPHTAHPCAAMHFVGYGNFTDADRQTSHYSTRSYERYLKDVNAWEFTRDNIAAQFGDLSNLSAFDMDMSGYSAYLNNIYMSGVIKQFQEIPVRLEIDTQGDSFLAWGEAIPVTCRVMKAFDDVTEHVASWAITRDTGDPVADTAWLLKAKVQNFAGNIEIAHKSTDNDLGVSEYNISTLFTITATMDDGFMAQFYLTF